MARKTRRRVKRVKGTRRIRRIRRIKTYYKGGNRRQNIKGGFDLTGALDRVKELGSTVQDNLTKAKEEVEKKISEVTSKKDTPSV